MGEELTTAELGTWVARLANLSPARDEFERIDRIRLMEEVKAALSAAQARETAAFKQAQLAAEEAAGVPARQRGRDVGAQVALARRESPHKGSRLVGLADALTHEMPHTLAALERGEINEWRATRVVRETTCLSREHRRAVDAELAGRLATWGDKRVGAETRKLAYRLDPHAALARIRQAESERRVTLRPAPDSMTYLTALLPLAQGVATYAALKREADTHQAAGTPRSRGQVMADSLVERVTGQAQADRVPLEVQLIVSDATLAGTSDEPAQISGHGPVPAPWARAMVADTKAALWLRRLYSDGVRLVAMESRRRRFPRTLRSFLVARDQTCRTPWCDAPIRHIDHIVPVELGGETTRANGQGLCVACNHAKQATGWQAQPGPDEEVQVTTPAGHGYSSRPPPPPAGMTSMERWMARLIEYYAA